MAQRIEVPTPEDVNRIAHQLVHAEEVVAQVADASLSGGRSDLALLQQTLDSKLVEREATYSLQALGIAFGRVFVENNEHYGWWMVEDEFGRDPAIRYKETTLLVFPQTMISKRVEAGKAVDVHTMYEELCKQLERIRADNYPSI